MALVDARGRGVDEDAHLGREVLGLAIETDTGHVDRRSLLRTVVAKEVQGGEAMLAVDDEILAAWLLKIADVLEPADRLERELLLGEEQHRARDRRLADGGFVEIGDRADLRL